MDIAERPTGGFVLSLIGGLIILLVGALLYVAASFFSLFIGAASSAGATTTGLVGISMTIGTMGIIGVVCGLLVMVFGILMFVMPKYHLIWGVLVLVLSLVSILGLGGFILGMILGIVGGILGIVFKPSAPMVAPPPMQAPPQ